MEGDLRYFEAHGAIRYLWARGIDEIGTLVICPASMRNIEGLEHLVSRISVREVLCNPYLLTGSSAIADRLDSRGIAVDRLLGNRLIELEGARISLIAPHYPPGQSRAVDNSGASIRCKILRDGIARQKAN